MSEPKFYTVFEADSAYLKALGDTNTYFSEFEVRLKTLEALGGKIDDSITSLLEVEKKILETVGGIATTTNDIFELRKEIAKAQGLDVSEDFNIWDVAQQEPPVGPVEDPADDLTLPYVTFRAEEAGSTIGLNKIGTTQTLSYSTDKSTWNTFDTSTNVTLANVGDEVYVRGKQPDSNSGSNYIQFKMTGKIAAYGNCNAIFNYQNLNQTTAYKYCGYSMFENCTALTKAPKLPATTLSYYCYKNMFKNCTSLLKAPELPASGYAPEQCYFHMFYGCTSLVEAPEILPATTNGTGSLIKNCYNGMFQNCTSLTKAPILPAKFLADSCYGNMFYGCKSLKEITCLATSVTANYCLSLWVGNVSSTGTFYKDPSMTSWPTGASGIPSGWTVVDYAG